MRTFALILVVVAVAVVTASASARAQSQNMGVSWVIGGGPACNVGGNPDDKACLSSNQDNVAPLAAPWFSAVRANASLNWSLTYGAWVLNSSVLANLANVRSATVDLSLNPTLHNIANVSQRAWSRVTVHLSADTPYVVISVEHIGAPSSVAWRGSNLTWRYDASVAGGTLTFTVTFTAGDLVVGFSGSGGGGATAVPYLPGLTNFQQFDVIPNLAQIAAFSCNNVTLTDPRSTRDIASTRLWMFDWGDGTPQTRIASPVASHLYGRPGIYNVTMTVQTVSGTGIGYRGSVDTSLGSCALHIVRQVAFVVLAFATGLLVLFSIVLPKRTKKERKRMRRQAIGCAVALLILVVVL